MSQPVIPPTPRDQLRLLSRSARSGVLTVAAAAAALGLPDRGAALTLGRLERAGWLKRIRRGLYHIVPLEGGAGTVVEDPWVLADAAFAPCYIGGWTAAHYWGLTEQSFRATFVATAANLRARAQTLLGTEYRLVRVPVTRVESVPLTWRGAVQLRVASAERAIVDACDDPAWVGGIRHLGEIVLRYREIQSDRGAALLLELERRASGAAFRRAGYLAERLWPGASDLIAGALANRPAGVIRLDPVIQGRGTMSRRWGLWVNVDPGERTS